MPGYSDLKILESRKSEKKVNRPFPVPSHLKMEFRIIETKGRIAQNLPGGNITVKRTHS